MNNNSSFMTSPCRAETFSKNNVTVFRDNFSSLHFARQVATIKNLQADSRPFYVMDMRRVSELLDVWRDYLPRVRPFYSVNCNADDVLLKVLADRAEVGFHCRTRQHLDKALNHVAPERVLYSNACWTRSTAAHAAACEIQRLSFESARDLTRLFASIGGTASSTAVELVLNVCVSDTDAGYGENDDMEVAFGCALADAPELLQLANDMGVPCTGIAFNLGNAGAFSSSILSRYETAIAEMARLFDFARCMGAPLRLLNIGGDFSAQSDCVSFAKICARINESLDYYFPDGKYLDLEVIATPGRFIAESAFTLITNVIGRRVVDASYVTNDDFDSGTEAFIYETNEGYYGSFGCQINANCNPHCAPLFDRQRYESKDEYVYGNVIGPTCDERFDLLESRCYFRPLHVGEWLIWANMGAYTLNNCDDTAMDSECNNGGAVKSPPTIFYFTCQRNWDQLNSDLMSVSQMGDSVPTPSFYRIYADEDDEGIRSASPSSLISTEDDENFFVGLNDDYFDVKEKEDL